jgi:hypothetical protein
MPRAISRGRGREDDGGELRHRDRPVLPYFIAEPSLVVQVSRIILADGPCKQFYCQVHSLFDIRK